MFLGRGDLKLPDIENIWIESADLVIGVIYKHNLEEILCKIYLSKRRCLIMEDININTH